MDGFIFALYTIPVFVFVFSKRLLKSFLTRRFPAYILVLSLKNRPSKTI
nr:MAG TPA: hypothetical protein [Caudoviricetes sp.]